MTKKLKKKIKKEINRNYLNEMYLFIYYNKCEGGCVKRHSH